MDTHSHVRPAAGPAVIPMARQLMSCRDAAAILGVSDETVRRWYHAGRLDGVALAERTIRIRTDAVTAMLGIAHS
jgi:excisionase family DNA binding protein